MIWLDTETTGLSSYTAQLTYVGLAFDDEDPIVLRHPDDRTAIQAALAFEDRFGGHNISFDMGFFEAAGYRVPPPERWVDTVLIAHVAGERKPGQTALARLQKELVSASILPASILEPEKALKRWLTKARKQAKKDGARRPEKGDELLNLVGPYLAADVASARAVSAYYGSRVNGQAGILKLEQRCVPAIYAAQQRGVPVDFDSTRELRDKTEMDLGDRRVELFETAGGPFNPNANQQIRRIMTNRGLDLSGFPRTPKTNDPMLTQESLQSVAEDEFVAALLRFREAKKLHDYVHDTWRHVHGTRLYGTFRQLGTVTGRMSSAAPNLQNIPRSNLSIRIALQLAQVKSW